jgi:MFS family permease
MAFLLSGAPFDYGDTTIGLFGLVGAAGAICANFAGRWADQGLTRGTTLVFAACIAISFLPLWYGRHDLAMLIIGILILDIGAQGLMVTNQSLIYRLTPEFRSRITSAYMVSYFVGGAIGSALGSTLYDTYGWAGVATLGAVLGIIATLAAVVDTIRRPTLPADDSTRARRRLSKRDLRTLSNEGTVVPSLQEPTTILSNTPLRRLGGPMDSTTMEVSRRAGQADDAC